jgi:Flp pilus assembly protein TadG
MNAIAHMLRAAAKVPLARIRRCNSGQTLILFGLSLLPILGVIGLALDGGQWMLWKRQLRTAADLSALAGANAIGDGHPVKSSVERALTRNATRSFTIIAIQSPPTSGSRIGKTNAVRVVLETQQPLPFSSVFVKQAPKIRVVSTAEVRNEVPNCVIALDGTETTGLSVSGSASVTMNCGMATNAAGSSALLADGQLVDVAALSAVGSVVEGSAVTPGTMINEGISPVGDPYAGRLPIPDLSTVCAGAVDVSAKPQDVLTISPGCYGSLNVDGTLYLQPGTYYLDRAATGSGNVEIAATGHIKGDGVTLIFTNSGSSPAGGDFGRFKANGTSMVELSAPTSGTYQGVVMYQDRRATPGSTTNFLVAGNSGTNNQGHSVLSYIQGSVYSPGSNTTMTGNSSLRTDCMQLVAKRVTFTGNTTIKNTCPSGSGAQAYGGTKVTRLVE